MEAKVIGRNLTALVVTDVIAKALPFLTFPFLTRVLGPETYGKYGFATSVTAFLALLASPGFVPWGIRAVAQRPGEERALGGIINGIRMAFGLLGFILLLAYAFTLAPPDGTIRLLLLLGGLTIFPAAFNLDWLLIGKSLILPVALAGIIGQMTYTAAVLSFIRAPSHVWMLPLAVLAGALVTNAILRVVASRRFGRIPPRFDRKEFREIIPQSLLLGFASMMSMLYDKVDTIILAYFRPMAEVGLYTANYRLMMVTTSFIPILGRVFFPLVAGSFSAEGGDVKHSGLYLRLFFLVSLPLVSGGILVAEPLSRLVIGEEYQGSGVLLSLLLPNVVLGGLASYYAAVRLLAMNRNRQYVLCVAAGGMLNLLANLALIPRWGVTVAAVTTCVSQGLVAAMAAWFGRDGHAPPLMPTLRLPVLGSAAMIAALLAARRVFPGMHVLVETSFGALVYAAVIFLAWNRVSSASRRGGGVRKTGENAPPAEED